MRKGLIGILTMTLVTAAVFAQMDQRETVRTAISGRNISIDYGRPSLKGRSFDELTQQLPPDRMWRAGSGQITTLTVEGPVMMGGQMVAPGKYSVYVHCPEEGDYSLVLNRVLGQPLGKIWKEAPESRANDPYPHFNYEKEIGDSEIARIPMKKEANDDYVDLFTISFGETYYGTSQLKLAWGKHSWTLNINSGRREGS